MVGMDMRRTVEARDASMLARCIDLSRYATSQGENPFACVIGRDDEVIAEATTRERRDADVTRHAEIIAISDAQAKLGTTKLWKCTLYSTLEPCAMCAFCIRASGIARVVYSIPSSIMGGSSKWDILGDHDLSDALPEVFHKPPQIVAGLMENEAEQVWREWHPIDWAVLRHRHAVGQSLVRPVHGGQSAPRKPFLWNRLRSWLGGDS